MEDTKPRKMIPSAFALKFERMSEKNEDFLHNRSITRLNMFNPLGKRVRNELVREIFISTKKTEKISHKTNQKHNSRNLHSHIELRHKLPKTTSI